MNSSRKKAESKSAAHKHLEAISNQLQITSPHISAFIASQLQQANPSPSHANSIPERCRACGQSLIPGWSCTMSRRDHLSRPSKDKKSKTKSKVAKKPTMPAATRIDYECALCNSVNTVKSDPKTSARRSKLGKQAIETRASPVSVPAPIVAPAAKSLVATAATPSLAPSTASPSLSDQTRGAGDKKRNRKQKLGGLQAMLAKSKAPSAAPKAFDFMDFMKTA